MMGNRSHVRLFGVLLLGLGLATGCGLMPKFEIQEAREQIPAMRTFLLAHVDDLNEAEKEFILSTDPVIGHANYMIYYYWWKDADGKCLFCVESSSPSSGVGPGRAYRCDKR